MPLICPVFYGTTGTAGHVVFFQQLTLDAVSQYRPQSKNHGTDSPAKPRKVQHVSRWA